MAGEEFQVNVRFEKPASDNFEKFRRDAKFCDFELVFGSGEQTLRIKAHRVILGGRSPYFEEFFQDHPNSRTLAPKGLIKCSNPEMEQEVFEILINYIYTYRMDVRLSARKMKCLMALSQKLQLTDIAGECIKAIEKSMDHITGENWASIRTYLKESGIKTLHLIMENWIKTNLLEIVEEVNMRSLKKAQILDLIKMFLGDSLSHNLLLQGIINWVSQDEDKRLKETHILTADLDLKAIYKDHPKLLLGSVLEKSPECLKILVGLYSESAAELVNLKESMGDVKNSSLLATGNFGSEASQPDDLDGYNEKSPEEGLLQTSPTLVQIPIGNKPSPEQASASPKTPRKSVAFALDIPSSSSSVGVSNDITTAANNVNEINSEPESLSSTHRANVFLDTATAENMPCTPQSLGMNAESSVRKSPIKRSRSEPSTSSKTAGTLSSVSDGFGCSSAASKSTGISGDTGERKLRKRGKSIPANGSAESKRRKSDNRVAIDFKLHLASVKKNDSMKILYAIQENGATHLQVFDFYTGDATNLYTLPTVRKHCNLVYFNGRVYCVGGTGARSNFFPPITDVDEFSPNNPEGKQAPPLNTPVKMAAVCVFRDSIYVTGGCETNRDTTSDTQKWDGNPDDGFKQMNYLNHPREAHCVAVLGDRMYAVGGHGRYSKKETYTHPLNSTEVYSPKMDCWEFIPYARMNDPREYFSLISFDKHLYAIGGFSTESHTQSLALNSAEVFDGKTWKHISPMNCGRAKACAFARNGLIYVFGGNFGAQTAEYYDPGQHQWTMITWPDGLPVPQPDVFNFYYAILMP